MKVLCEMICEIQPLSLTSCTGDAVAWIIPSPSPVDLAPCKSSLAPCMKLSDPSQSRSAWHPSMLLLYKNVPQTIPQDEHRKVVLVMKTLNLTAQTTAPCRVGEELAVLDDSSVSHRSMSPSEPGSTQMQSSRNLRSLRLCARNAPELPASL